MSIDLNVFVFNSSNGLPIENAYFGASAAGGATSYSRGYGWYMVRVGDNGSFWVDANGYGQMYAWAGAFRTLQVALPPVSWPNS
jgi:hypothetical protein